MYNQQFCSEFRGCRHELGVGGGMGVVFHNEVFYEHFTIAPSPGLVCTCSPGIVTLGVALFSHQCMYTYLDLHQKLRLESGK